MIASALLAVAAAAEVDVSAGINNVSNDPFIQRTGPQFGVAVGPNDTFAVGLTAGAYLDRGSEDWRPITGQLVNEYQISPDISRMRMRSEAFLRFTPLAREGDTLWTRAGGYFGAGVVQTVDDGEALQAEGDPAFEATQVQLHPTLLLGACAEGGVGGVGIRGRSELLRYVETVNSTTTEVKANHLLAVDLVLHFGAGESLLR